jgi:hypothetical protein
MLAGSYDFSALVLSLRSRRQHKAWGRKPQESVSRAKRAHEVGDSQWPPPVTRA